MPSVLARVEGVLGSSRVLMITTVVLLVAVVAAAIVAWLITRQPPLTPVKICSGSEG
jgi:membrane associated rhomboid family serine protease